MREEKKLLLEEIKEKITSSQAMVIVSYNKHDPQSSWALSKELQKSDSDFEVVKKRVFLKAVKEAGIDAELSGLKGHVGVLFAYGDTLGATKSLYQYKKDNDVLDVIAGQFEGVSYSASEVEQLSKLPAKDEMRASLLGLFEAPMSETLAVMESLLTSVIHCINNKSQKEESK